MMEPIKEELSPKYLRPKDMEHTWAPQLKELLKDTLVTVIAELGKSTQTCHQCRPGPKIPGVSGNN
jgi:hypothetical protein